VIIHISNRQSALEINNEETQKIVSSVISAEGQSADEVSIYFVDTEEICQLHQTYFDDPSTTDCISFPMDPPDEPGYRLLGELFVCPETAFTYCATHGGTPKQETILYLVHALLHLMGYDDIEEEDRMEMRAAEQRHLTLLREHSLLAGETKETA
jgi:probable rRNA maturation factor